MQHQQYAEKRSLLGSLCPGQKKLEGKTFYLDSVKKRSTALLLEAISLLGGRVESFLHKDVSFVVTGSQEYLKEQNCTDTKVEAKGTSEESQRPVMSKEKLRPGTPRPAAYGSRGKALLEKAMRNNERLQMSSVLANARSWGVKILYVDDVVFYMKQLTRESLSVTHKKPEQKTYAKQQGSHVVKAAALRSPYLKIEDLSRKYKPLHMQSMTFPTLCYSGRFSPFESPPPTFEKRTEKEENKTREKKKVVSSIEDQSQTPLSCNPSPWRPRKKDHSFCECCHQPFNNLEEHLQSDQHRAFVLDLTNYSVVDQLAAEMLPGFNPSPPEQSEEMLNQPPTPLLIQDACELEPLTDLETEHAVQALQRQGSLFNTHIPSPTRGPLSCGSASPSPGVLLPIPNPASPPSGIQPFTTTAVCQIADSHPHASSPTMPVLDEEMQPQPDTQLVSPCLDTPCPYPDPYSLPPVLSPQIPYPSYIMEPHCPYSDPPVLSPQWYNAEEDVEGHTCEMNTTESVCRSDPAVTISVSTPLLPFLTLTNAEGQKVSNQDSLLGFSGIICSTNGLECARLCSRRSRSLPRQSAISQNPKKRCRSASPGHSRSKRRRIGMKFGHSSSRTKQGNEYAKAESDIIAKPEGCFTDSCQSFPNPEVPSTCATETIDLEQTCSMFCHPTVRNLTNHMDSLCHGSTSVANQQSWPPSAKENIFNPPPQLPTGKRHRAFSSQDSQRSLSHSTSVCIESALIPDLAALSPSSSESDWDCDLLSRLAPASAAPLTPAEQSCELDKEVLQRPCTWMLDTSYESHLHTVLQPSNPSASMCGEEMDPTVFSRTVVPIVEVQH